MDLKKHNLLVALTIAVAITFGAIAYLGVSLGRVGGPYNVDSDGCGYKYVSFPGHGERQVRSCMDDDFFVPVAKLLAIAGPLASIGLVVLLLLSTKQKKKSSE